MLKKDKVNFIINKLDEIYPEVSPPLTHSNHYTLLIAVLLSANTTDKSVNKITPTLFAKANTPQKMITLDYETIYSIIRPCGLGPAKSRAILGLSQILVDKYNGKVPNDFSALESFPGVGHKTASVVMSQAFGVPAFAVDTHVHRLMYRWGLSSGRSVKETEKDAKRLFPEQKWSKLHLQIVFYGRTYCPAKNFNPEKCPITSVVGRRSLFR
ncbi:MAG: endonuclease III [Candidatus Marinimicrobia bacterium]|jgi:endonuclease III|nr:endonuclease III [Candidatus Neomarinimicrobiota bacterium]|tara:strand:- start:3811 stop:4446 length:636 start_codon:yes stop_codon:yes gene_type:complete